MLKTIFVLLVVFGLFLLFGCSSTDENVAFVSKKRSVYKVYISPVGFNGENKTIAEFLNSEIDICVKESESLFYMSNRVGAKWILKVKMLWYRDHILTVDEFGRRKSGILTASYDIKIIDNRSNRVLLHRILPDLSMNYDSRGVAGISDDHRARAFMKISAKGIVEVLITGWNKSR